jgi:hypothetical protein
MLPTRTNWIILYFQTAIIVTTDLQALKHIFNAPEFDKTEADRQSLGQFTGRGLPNFLSNCGSV